MSKKQKETLINQALRTVVGFEQIDNKLCRSVKLNSLSESTYKNYIRAIAKVSIHFNKTPLALSLEQIEDYLLLQKEAWEPSESYFKHTVYGLRYLFRLYDRKADSLKFPVQAMSLVFRAVFVKKLRKNAKKEGLVLPKSLFNQLFAKKWVVFAKQPFLGPNQIIEYIGRYTHKIAISNHRIQNIKDGKVVFKYKDYRKGGQNKVMSLSEIEFIRRFSLHILPHRFTRIRHFGILNTKSKFSIADVIAAIKNTGKLMVQVSKENIAKPIKILPKCPICKHGNMHILVFGSGLDPRPDLEKLKQNDISSYYKMIFE